MRHRRMPRPDGRSIDGMALTESCSSQLSVTAICRAQMDELSAERDSFRAALEVGSKDAVAPKDLAA